ncbi:GTP-binding protein [Shewanella sp. AS1]|uniref:CobW family GTP-binding protein n=1 Tax=Shewanella sp. AS1 TaxID=2907626 RepID=UPI001F398A36|nr:GTP-binding protein [Shewanella sp. AS1]MCE9679130.1 GTP-binding protein [Shewanella sp. AS1]
MIIQAIPTHVITGFLGVGKTSFIKYLLANKPQDEVWAVLVNEFGEIGIDGALLESQSGPASQSGTSYSGTVAIKEVAGGCICCASGVPTQVAVNQLIAKARPQRLFIEPTGLGHPKAIIQTLTQSHFRQVIALKSTICLVDARKLDDERYRDNDTFNQQLAIGDLILATKKDLSEEVQLNRLKEYLARKGICAPVVPINLLDAEIEYQGLSFYDWLAKTHWHKAAQSLNNKTQGQSEGPSLLTASLFGDGREQNQVHTQLEFDARGVYRRSNQHEGIYTAGWVFDYFHEFDFDALLAWVKWQNCLRLKAVMICSEGIVAINLVEGQLSLVELDDALDSRLEMICEQAIGLDAIEAQLCALIDNLGR